jgi:UDP-2,3-diacylglucosamine hydrolase
MRDQLGVEKPIQALFISDLHLQPERPVLTERFFQLLDWAKPRTDTLYILGDFFHAWAGDDSLDDWSRQIAQRLAALKNEGVACYFMAGNRDFLFGKSFADLTGWVQLPDPQLIELGGHRILLSHGDRYCTADKAHQWFRRLTRWPGFPLVFGWFPLSWRKKWVNRVRQYSSAQNRHKSEKKMDVVPQAIIRSMQRANAQVMIHGHTHVSKQVQHESGTSVYTRYVLSDWDDSPVILCYYKPYGFRFEPLDRG